MGPVNHRWDAANGLAFDSEGNLIACADMHGEIWKRNNKILFITGPVDKVTAVKMNVKGAANW